MIYPTTLLLMMNNWIFYSLLQVTLPSILRILKNQCNLDFRRSKHRAVKSPVFPTGAQWLLSQFLHFWLFPTNTHSKKQQVMAQVRGPLQRGPLLTAGSRITQSWLAQAFREVKQQMEDDYIFCSFDSLSNKIKINF